MALSRLAAAVAVSVSVSVWFSVAAADTAAPGIPQSSVGPRSDAEATLLWSEGSNAAASGDCLHAVTPLRRFADRYPGHENYLRAHFLLGRCDLANGETAEAIRALRYFLGGADARASADYLPAKTMLARALLKIGDPAEALLAATELEREAGQLSQPALAEALILKAEALATRHEDERSLRSLDSARHLLTAAKDDRALDALRSEAAWLALLLNTHDCARYPSHERMDEAQARSQLDRRGDCEMSGLLLFREVAGLKSSAWIDRSAGDLLTSFDDYAKACVSPPLPRGKRAPVQLRRYKDELRAMLTDACLHRYQEARSLMERWRGDSELAPWGASLERVEGGIQGQAQMLAKSRSTGSS